jgi:hypothetical protein
MLDSLHPFSFADLFFFFFLFACAQGPDAIVDPDEVVSIPQAEAAERASAAFQSVFENGAKIELDHYVVYFARKRSRLSLSPPHVCG